MGVRRWWVAAAAIFLAGQAQAAVISSGSDVFRTGPLGGPDGAILMPNGAVTLTLTFDKTLVSSLSGYAFGGLTGYYYQPCSGAGPQGPYCWVTQNESTWDLHFNADAAGDYSVFHAPQIFVRPNDAGVTVTWRPDTACPPTDNFKNCFAADTLQFLSFSATTPGQDPVPYSWTIENTSHGVPEPATWAMMIAGFGMVGSALRRRPLAA